MTGNAAAGEISPLAAHAGGCDATAAEVVGGAYEQSLAEPARRANGVYYTPRYIVDFIVRQTVGRLLDERRFTVLDPACGGGAFLLGAYRCLLDHHAAQAGVGTGSFGQTPLERRARILLDHIHGVDIDAQAVELTRWELMRLLLNGEAPTRHGEIVEATWAGLMHNIQCGDALGGRRSDRQMGFWEDAFGDVLDAGGFDAVIGNPPYLKEYTNREVFQELRQGPFAKYCAGKMDLWYAFACLAIDLLREGGWHSFIVTNNWGTSTGAKVLRRKIRTECDLEQVIDFGPCLIFGQAAVQTMIYVARKASRQNGHQISYTRVTRADAGEREIRSVLMGGESSAAKRFVACIPPTRVDSAFTFVDQSRQMVLDKIASIGCWRLRPDEIAQGIVPNPDVASRRAISNVTSGSSIQAGDPVFVVPRGFFPALSVAEAGFLKPTYEPAELQRYRLPSEHSRELIYLTRANDPGNLRAIESHLFKYRELMQQRRETRLGRLACKHLHWPRDEQFFAHGAKILCVRKCRRPVCVYTEQPAYVMLSINVIRTNRVDMKVLTALLNSRLMHFWLDQCGKKQGAQLQIDKEPLTALPLLSPRVTSKRTASQIGLLRELVEERIVLARGEQPTPEDQPLADRNGELDVRIDELVDNLYGMSAADIAIMEEALAETEHPCRARSAV